MDNKTWTGEDLEAIRRASRVHQSEVARRMGVVRSRVSMLEGSRRVTDSAARRFLDAVAAAAAEPLR